MRLPEIAGKHELYPLCPVVYPHLDDGRAQYMTGITKAYADMWMYLQHRVIGYGAQQAETIFGILHGVKRR